MPRAGWLISRAASDESLLAITPDATETFVTDKRPFFTENQGIFEFTTPSDFSQLLYTRRPADRPTTLDDYGQLLNYQFRISRESRLRDDDQLLIKLSYRFES